MIKVYKGYSTLIQFKFYKSDLVTPDNISEAKANLYSVRDGSLILSDIVLTPNYETNTFDYLFSPDNTFETGTYYFVAIATLNDGSTLRSIEFIDILEPDITLSLIDLEQVAKMVNDFEVDYSLLGTFAQVATEFVESRVGIVFPKDFSEILPKTSNHIYYLSKSPLIEITNVKILAKALEEIIATINYQIMDNEISKVMIDVDKNYFYVQFDYKAGYNPIPETVMQAIHLLTAYLYDNRKYMSFQRLRMVGIEAVIDKDFLEQIDRILMPYRKIW